MARRIVDFRERHGTFNSLQDLDQVHGIGPRTLQMIEPFVVPISPGDSSADPRVANRAASHSEPQLPKVPYRQ